MNYKRQYKLLIKKRGRKVKPLEGYFENHHIVPKSMSGQDTPDNLVYLTAKEHFIAHWLLYKIHKNYKMAFAFHLMSETSGAKTSSSYKAAREAIYSLEKAKCKYCHKVRLADNILVHEANCKNKTHKNCSICGLSVVKTFIVKHEANCEAIPPNCPTCKGVFSTHSIKRHLIACQSSSNKCCEGCGVSMHKTTLAKHKRICSNILTRVTNSFNTHEPRIGC